MFYTGVFVILKTMILNSKNVWKDEVSARYYTGDHGFPGAAEWLPFPHCSRTAAKTGRE